MMRLLAYAVVVAVACTKSGEHQSELSIGASLPTPAVDAIEAKLRARLADAGFRACTWPKPRPLQLGATPVAWFCGKLGDTTVEASLNRPGMRASAIELDLRADVEGSSAAITRLEKPVMTFRNDTYAWVCRELRGWLAGYDVKSGITLGTTGAVLGDETGAPDPLCRW
jgi:hypothetical protein